MASPESPFVTGTSDDAGHDAFRGGKGATAPYTGGLRRHERDAVSLMGGLLLLLVAGAVLLTDLTSLTVNGRWVVPVVLLAVGAVGLLATLRPSRAEHSAGD